MRSGSTPSRPVVAYDPAARRWLTGPPTAGQVAVPELDGELTTDPAALAAASADYGHHVHRTPGAVLRPGSVRDVVRLLRFTHTHRIPVATRGQGHSTAGQAQVDGGVVIDSTTLRRVHDVGRDRAVVDAGATWSALTRHTLAAGLVPPVLPDYLDLSVGGTLSSGGIGGTTWRHGLQIDTVLDLDVVTGTGEPVHCSPDEHGALFDAVLGGLGQYAVIVRATVALVPAPERVRGYQLHHPDLDGYLAAARRCLAEHRFDSLQGQARATDDGRWEFMIDAAVHLSGTAAPDDAARTGGLGVDASRTEVTDQSFEEWIHRLRPGVEELTAAGLWDLPHPWINLFLPSSRTADVVSATLAGLTPADVGPGPVLLYPFDTRRLRRPGVPVPDEPEAFLFALLRTTVPPATPEAQLAANRALYERARDAGGKRYPVDSVPMTPDDWRDHYGPAYPAVVAARSTWDPRHTLAPGRRIVR